MSDISALDKVDFKELCYLGLRSKNTIVNFLKKKYLNISYH